MVVSTVLDYNNPGSVVLVVTASRFRPYLSVGQLKDQLDLVPINKLLLDLGGNPSLCGIRLPCPSADIVAV